MSSHVLFQKQFLCYFLKVIRQNPIFYLWLVFDVPEQLVGLHHFQPFVLHRFDHSAFKVDLSLPDFGKTQICFFHRGLEIQAELPGDIFCRRALVFLCKCVLKPCSCPEFGHVSVWVSPGPVVSLLLLSVPHKVFVPRSAAGGDPICWTGTSASVHDPDKAQTHLQNEKRSAERSSVQATYLESGLYLRLWQALLMLVNMKQ